MWTIVEASADKTALIPEFDEPLMLGEEPPVPGHWFKVLTYLAGCIVLLILLVAQILYHYQDYFLRHSLWRPLIASACEQLRCELPAEKNSAALRSVFLSVDPLPGYEDMLQATFRVQNTAMYPQAFPAAELSFSDTDNKLIAARRFNPDHYLAADLLSEGFIAAGAEMEGTIVVRNPGDDAVNYRLEFVYENN